MRSPTDRDGYSFELNDLNRPTSSLKKTNLKRNAKFLLLCKFRCFLSFVLFLMLNVYSNRNKYSLLINSLEIFFFFQIHKENKRKRFGCVSFIFNADFYSTDIYFLFCFLVVFNSIYFN